ncbi:MAG: bifunctional glycosyltransferase family 2/GtrA family protein [Candidatus Solibacter sp.]|jgi:glycosyltransferase involved in cell wall biosynthesis
MPLEQPVQQVVLIPAYQPSAGLADLVRDLSGRGMPAILLVDDGSGPEFRGIFDRAGQFPGVRVLRHAVNLGKGAALKTGINHALCAFPGLTGIVTADADGQHHPEDIERVAASLREHPDALVLGSRTFDTAVPLRSRFGNILTRKLMQTLIGSKLQDTQTGLRGIPAALAARLLSVEARGYEFELEMLIAARQGGVAIVEVPIRTIYEPGNKSSHFNPLTDSMKIYFVLVRFSSVSLMTALLDNLIFYLVWKRTGHILGAQVLARLASVVFNYSMVRGRVFASREAHQVLLPKYLLLVATSGTASYLGIRYLTAHLGVTAMPAKLFVETLLFFVNFAVQRMFIFHGPEANGERNRARRERTMPGRFYSWLILAVLAVLVALEVYGFRTSHVFSQEIWAPEGRARLLQFGALYLDAAAALLILAPWAFVPLAAALLVVLTAIGVGPLAFLAVLFFLLSAWSLGGLILRPRGSAPQTRSLTLGARIGAPTVREGLPPHLLSILLGMSIYIFFLPFAARLPVNYWWVYAPVLAIPIVANRASLRRELPAILRLPGGLELRAWSERLGCAAFVFVLATHWFAMLKPEASADGLSVHLAVSANIAAHHRMTLEPGRILWSVMPMGADFTYSTVYLLGGEMAARLLNFTILLVLLGLLHAAVRRSVSPGAAWLLVTLFATTPMVQLVTGSLFVENLLTAFLLAMMTALWRFGESGERRFLYLAAALGGTALATKFGAIAFVLPALVCAAVEVWLHRKRSGARWGLAIGLLLVSAAPPYGIAWVKTGNPLFPFRNDKIHSRQLDPKADIQDLRFRQPLTWNTPYDLTFRSNRYYEGQHGSFGFQYLVMAPLALLALMVAPRRQAVGAAVVAITAILLILNSEPNARYLYPALPLLFVPFAALLGWASDHQRVLARALVAFVIACAALNVYFLPASGYHHKDLYGPFTPGQREVYMSETAPIRNVIAWFNRAHPQAAVLLTQDSDIAGLGGDVYENHWHQFNTLDQIRRADGVEGIRRLLDGWKVRYLIARKPTASHYARPLAMRELLDQCTIAEYTFNEFYVARVEPVCRMAAPLAMLPLVTARPGTYDDFDPTILLLGDWERNDGFEQAYHHTVTYTDTPGAEIRLAFEGRELTYVFTKASNRGMAAIAIDGISRGTIDLYSAVTQWQSSVRFADLGPGRHLLAIRVTGESRAGATGKFVDLDALTVK